MNKIIIIKEIATISNGLYSIKSKLERSILDFFDSEYIEILNDKTVNIYVTDDVKKCCCSFNAKYAKETIDNNGLVLLPDSEHSKTYNVIFKDTIFLDYQYLSTVFHEFTHVIDYSEFFNACGNLFLKDNDTKINNYYYEFYLWSEFHAKKIGIKWLMDYLISLGGTFDLKQYAKDINQIMMFGRDELNKYYELVHFLGRLAVFESIRNIPITEFSNDEFPSDFLQIYNYNIVDLHNTLNNINSFKEFDTNKLKIRNLLNLKYQNTYRIVM